MSLHKERTTSSDVGGSRSGKCMILKHFELAVDSLLHNSGLNIQAQDQIQDVFYPMYLK